MRRLSLARWSLGAARGTGVGVRSGTRVAVALASVLSGACGWHDDARSAADCLALLDRGFRPFAVERGQRFLGKVEEATARCRGGDAAVARRTGPWVDWSSYWAAGDASSKGRPGTTQDRRGLEGALLDLEYQRVELIEFNLFDNQTYAAYLKGRDGVPGPSLKVWPELRLPKGHPHYADVGGNTQQLCRGDLIRHRTLTGICNDLRNPAMGSTGQLFGRVVEFDATFPDLGRTELTRKRHGGRLTLLEPDPQVVSRVLFTRAQAHPERCGGGLGLEGDARDAQCDYQKADTLNILATFWIQFMTHDWFSHLEEGHNRPGSTTTTGCASQLEGGVARPLAATDVARLGCRPDDHMDRAYFDADGEPATTEHRGVSRPTRAYKTTHNTVTAWWDASQMYGYDAPSRQRVKRDPADPAKLQLVATPGEPRGYLPLLTSQDAGSPEWAGQEATAFPDNWNLGLSFFHNLFAREHNAFIDAFRAQAARTPEADCGLRDPARPERAVDYEDVTDDELFEVARLVMSAEIAKIHTLEWTPQLLYNEPLRLAMNANWSGLLDGHEALTRALGRVVRALGRRRDAASSNAWYSVLASGPGIFGLGNRVYAGGGLARAAGRDLWDLRNPDHVNGGVNHFGSPFSFPEEFVSVYRLHALVPDLLEYRRLADAPDVVRAKVPVVATFRGAATERLRAGGLANWALSMGRQRAGALTLRNHPLFLQDLPMDRARTDTGRLDVAALDLLRDRERGVPRFNEFRRQLGLTQLTSFDDFVDPRLPTDAPKRARQADLARRLREVYGHHRCETGKTISGVQLGAALDDCLGHPPGSLVDNVEDLDAVVGWLAEPLRPHGFAISETQFQVFMLSASRRLFSDRFFTSSFRPEFYSALGVRWVEDNGPDGKLMEAGEPNGHRQEVSPLKRVLLRAIPELAPELGPVVNVFDPWARERGEYYSLAWRPRHDAGADEAFRP